MKQTDSILDTIVANKRQQVAQREQQKSRAELERAVASLPVTDQPGFFDILKASQPTPKIIAEMKQASPSAGNLRTDFSLDGVNQAYQAAGNVVAISVITESVHFKGDDDSLRFVANHNTHRKPLLRKDFIFDEYQILESKLLGAQAYLLIASLFEVDELQLLVDFGQSIGLEPLVEVHDEPELAMATQTNTRCIGVNSRDLRTFTIDMSAHELLHKVGSSYARVAESGIDTAEKLNHVMNFADAALIGSHFMQSADIAEAIQEVVA